MHLPYISRYLKSYKMINYAIFDHFKIYAKKNPTNFLFIMLVINILPIAVYVGSVGRRRGRSVPESSLNGCNHLVGNYHLGMNRLAPFIGTILIELIHCVIRTMKIFTSKYNNRWEPICHPKKMSHIVSSSDMVFLCYSVHAI